MLLGHAYLTATKMTIAPLRHFSRLLSLGVSARIGVVVLSLAVAWFNPFLDGGGWQRVWLAVAGAGLGSGVLWGIGALYGRLRGGEAMGMGDVKMMALVGAFSGPAGVLFTIFFASFAGAIVGLAMIPLRGRSLQDTLPFGCFLAPAALVALIVGRQAVQAYFSVLLP